MYTLRHVLDDELAPFKPLTVEFYVHLPSRGDIVEIDLACYRVFRVVHRVIRDGKDFAAAGQPVVWVSSERG